MDKSHYINEKIREIWGKSYLEIGYGTGFNFDKIECEFKQGIDPVVNTDSDFFFKENEEIFDCIFIDGDHTAEQVRKDIINSMKCLSKDGVIILHDTIPHTKEMQEVPRIQREWTGTVWRAVVGFKKSYPDIRFETIRADYGLTFIYPNGRKAKKHFEKIEMLYEDFKENEVELLNII